MKNNYIKKPTIIDINLEDINEFQVHHAHGVDISARVQQLKKEFSFVTSVY